MDTHSSIGHSSIIANMEPQAKHCSSETLKTITDDCLHEICKYLSISEVVQLGSTCLRLQNFTKDFIFPKIARQMEITLKVESIMVVERSTIALNAMDFESFGSFVKQLTVIYVGEWEMKYTHSIEKILDSCQNLRSLCMYGIDFTTDDSQILSHVTPSLRKLKLELCSGITNDWCEELKRFSKLEILTLIGTDKINAKLFKNNLNLSKLTINLLNYSTEKDVENLFNHNSESIRQLKIIKFTKLHDYQSISTLIVNKLPNLEKLIIDGWFTVELTNSLTDLPHLKAMKVGCDGESVNSLLRKLSDLGVIEDLCIINGVVDDEDDNAPALVFNKLKSFRWHTIFKQDPLAVFKVLTKSQMPVIVGFNFKAGVEITGSLLAFFESKETIKSLIIDYFCFIWNKPNRNIFVLEIIKILKSNWNRSYLNLNIGPLDIGVELVSEIISKFYLLYFSHFFFLFFKQRTMLKANRHLINLDTRKKSNSSILYLVENT